MLTHSLTLSLLSKLYKGCYLVGIRILPAPFPSPPDMDRILEPFLIIGLDATKAFNCFRTFCGTFLPRFYYNKVATLANDAWKRMCQDACAGGRSRHTFSHTIMINMNICIDIFTIVRHRYIDVTRIYSPRNMWQKAHGMHRRRIP